VELYIFLGGKKTNLSYDIDGVDNSCITSLKKLKRDYLYYLSISNQDILDSNNIKMILNHCEMFSYSFYDDKVKGCDYLF